MIGSLGNDRMFGNAGFDTMDGGSGSDFISGGAGVNEIHGGGGADIFVFNPDNGNNYIYDFELGIDELFLRDFSGELRVFDSTYYDRDGVRYDGIGFSDANNDQYDSFTLIGYSRSDVAEIMNDMIFA
jgi:Ca2+-binding RTX toxin-like protein